jgi:hypothetical protein
VVVTLPLQNAGPFWVTVDLFDGEAQFRRYRDTPTLGAHVFAQVFTDAALVKRIPVDSLSRCAIAAE